MRSKAHSRTEPDLFWTPASYEESELREALVDGGVAGVNSHDRVNVMWKLKRLCEGDTDSQFGLTGVSGLPLQKVLSLVSDASGIDPDPDIQHGLVVVDPERVLRRCEAIGDRLALAAERGERVLLATGHPTGVSLLYQEVGRLLAQSGAQLLRPLEGTTWHDRRGRRRQIRYFVGVAMITDRGSALHTHSPEAMERMIAEERPDLVFADHGLAGAAIEAGIDTVAVADVNDPALVVAHHQGRSGPTVVMDDNVQPESYWPCFQAIASRFPSP
ncbi:MAG: phosphatase [Actinomycetota bacterium]